MAVSFEGQVAVVTGAGRGLGRAYALELAKLGARVVVNDPGVAMDGAQASAKPADEVCDEIRALGGEAEPSYASVASFAGGAEIVQTALDHWGRKGCFSVLRAAWPVFREQSYGRVVMATSTSGLYGNFGQANYGAAKAAMVGLMNVLKLEGEKYDVRVNLVAPSAATRMTENLMSDEQNAQYGPDHVAPVVALLASRDCPDSGVIIEAVAGRIARTAVLRGKGVNYEIDRARDVDWVMAHWDEITSLDDAKLWWDLTRPL
jgi:NAD(P)-dependent dehydrogenase (short-subunit alcohol dehydrogenase family)